MTASSVYQVRNATNGRTIAGVHLSRSMGEHMARRLSERWPGNHYVVRAIARCSSRCPAVGYGQCEQERSHAGTCAWGGYRWWRGRGHARPVLVVRPVRIEA